MEAGCAQKGVVLELGRPESVFAALPNGRMSALGRHGGYGTRIGAEADRARWAVDDRRCCGCMTDREQREDKKGLKFMLIV